MPNAWLERGWERREGEKSYFSAELAESHKTEHEGEWQLTEDTGHQEKLDRSRRVTCCVDKMSMKTVGLYRWIQAVEQPAVERNGTLRRKPECYTLSLFSAFLVLLLAKTSLEMDLLSYATSGQ